MELEKIKVPWNTKFFNKGQEVFVVESTGAQACLVSGKYRGNGRRILAWFKWNDKNMHLIKFNKVNVNNNQFKKLTKNKIK